LRWKKAENALSVLGKDKTTMNTGKTAESLDIIAFHLLTFDDNSLRRSWRKLDLGKSFGGNMRRR